MKEPAMTADPIATRLEHDLIGARDVPADAYWGVHTLRAVENFPITGQCLSQAGDLIVALAAIKQAAAEANRDLGLLEPARAEAIIAACGEIREGALHEQFVVDLIQGGAGTSTNMNANEVIANRALEIMGHSRGDYQHLHPNEDVNMGQSTNDVYPTALKLAAWAGIHRLADAMEVLHSGFAEKAREFSDVLKMGRTQMQDAVPMTLGQEFGTYAVMMAEDRTRLTEASMLICEINLGGTAIGTGITSHPLYAARARENLSRITGIDLITAADLIEATQDCGAFVQLSGVLKRIAVKLSKICSDLRLLSSGPRAGLNEIDLPAMQAGSSIMPGKVNPVIPEVVNQVAFEVIGNDMTITMCAEAGQLELNAFEPVAFYRLFESITALTGAVKTLVDNCIIGITANAERCQYLLDHSVSTVTALTPHIGYKHAADIAKTALKTDKTIRELVEEEKLLDEKKLEEVLDPFNMTVPGESLKK